VHGLRQAFEQGGLVLMANAHSNYELLKRNRPFSKKRIRSLAFDRAVEETQQHIDCGQFASARVLVRWSNHDTDSIVQQLDYEEKDIDFK
jgi:hypothetical protein